MTDMNGVLASVFDRANQQLTTTTVAGTPTSTVKSDENGAWAGCFDEATQSIRVVIV